MASERKGNDLKNWPHLLSVGVQVAALVGILLLGALLETDAAPPPATAELPPLPAPSGYRPAERLAPESAAPTPARQADEAPPDPRRELAQRAAEDAARLEALGPGYTLQLAMLCDAARVEEHLARNGERDELYLLPADHDGRLCFRLCWGHEASPELARTASTLPPSLRAAPSFPTSVAAVLE